MTDKTKRPSATVQSLVALTAGALAVGCGATSPSSPPPPPPGPPAQTEAGVPEGPPSTATIGPAGGTLASADGRLTISVPAGALASGTLITIQPITATAPGALGSGYRLSPEDVTLAQPATLTFSYPADEAGATVPQSLRVATRDARGYWTVMPATHDVAQRKLTITTTHFSDWSYVAGLQIKPASATVAVNKQLSLEVIDCGEGPDPDGGNSGQRLLLECVGEELPQLARNWSVNGIPGGTGAVGTVAGGSRATYSAPATVPAQNPVAVSAQVTLPAGLTTLVSNVRVVDALTVYTGSIFGRTVSTISGGGQNIVELSANVRFTYNPDLSFAGAKWYDATGTAFARVKPFGCSTYGSGTAPVSEGSASALVLHTEGSLAGTYAISVVAVVTITAMCGDPPKSVTFTAAAAAGAGGSDICPSLEIGNDPSRLAGSWSCNVSEGVSSTANWTFAAEGGAATGGPASNRTVRLIKRKGGE